MKIVTIVGARPQFVKAAVTSRAFLETGKCDEVIVHTGQHYDDNMSAVFFSELGIATPRYNLCIGSGLHGQQTGRMLEAIEGVLLDERPDCLVVYGDTNSTLAGTLAAVKLHIPIAHVEAGLRSFDRRMPEEINRIVTDHSSDLLFAPTDAASYNLAQEGITGCRVHLVGDVMYDAALYYGRRAETHSLALQRLGLSSKHYILATLHRAENTDDLRRLQVIVRALASVSQGLPVVLPLHPRTRKVLTDRAILGELTPGVRTIDPLGYMDMTMLEKHAKLVATDSGGVQKEAFFHRVPCVTFRETTEWVELVQMGWNRLIPPVDLATVLSGLHDGLQSSPVWSANPYGDGHAAERIARIIAEQGRGAAGFTPALDGAVVHMEAG